MMQFTMRLALRCSLHRFFEPRLPSLEVVLFIHLEAIMENNQKSNTRSTFHDDESIQ